MTDDAKIKYFYNNQRVTRKFVESQIGTAELNRRIAEAKKIWAPYPYTAVKWNDGIWLIYKEKKGY